MKARVERERDVCACPTKSFKPERMDARVERERERDFFFRSSFNSIIFYIIVNMIYKDHYYKKYYTLDREISIAC